MPFSKEASFGRSGRSVFSIHINHLPPLHFPFIPPLCPELCGHAGLPWLIFGVFFD